MEYSHVTPEEKQINTEYAVSLLEQLKLFYEQQLFTDMVLIVEGTEFLVIRWFLQHVALTQVLCCSGLSESKQTHMHLRNVDSATTHNNNLYIHG